MKVKINFKLVFLLAMLLIIYGACKRNVLEEPSPLGPSSLSTLLNVTASPNVLTAGTTRQASTITASLKKFDTVPLENKTIIFEICDDKGNIINVGYFEGNKSTETKVTDANGIATLSYYGPLASEVVGSTAVYIWASVASEGSESISQSTPVYIIGNVTEITLDMSANPNVLHAGTARGTSIITSALKTASGITLANQTIYFEICDADGNKVNTGYFEGNESVSTKITNASGIATVTYYGPIASEITGDTSVYIRATVALQGEESLSKKAPINIIQDAIEKTLEVSANPNVLNAGTTRETSTITATLKTVAGAPLASQTIKFEICDANGNKVNTGYFEGNESVSTKITNASGIATVTYYGPIASEITGNTSAYIRTTAALQGEEFLSKTARINIIQDEKTLTVSANPNVIVAGTTRATSTITATLKTAGGAPLASQTIHFEIYNAQGSKVNIGYFEGNVQVATMVTNASGVATATYYGPLATEVTGNTTIYIRATLASTGKEYLYNSAVINILRSQ